MIEESLDPIADLVSDALITASCSFSFDKKYAYQQALLKEKNTRAKWVLQQILDNSVAAEINKTPLCDDTGIPHMFLEVGPSKSVDGGLLKSINEGIALGLRRLPGRPMAVKGDEIERLGQTRGMYDDPGKLEPAPITIKAIDEDVLRLSILMFGGGPAIRGRSYRVFHKHDSKVVEDQIIEWAKEACRQLGCTPCTLAIGIGRSHYEAASLMLEAQVYGNYTVQSKFERRITKEVNESKCGPLGLGGSTTVLGTFAKIGPARASGVRIVCLRPCCCFEPRIAKVELSN